MIAEPRVGDPPARQIVSVNPATREPIGSAPVRSAEEVAAAYERARRASASWGATPVRERARVLARAARALAEMSDEVADLVAREVGKPRFEAYSTEILPVADLLATFAARAASMLKPEAFTLSLLKNKRSRLEYAPLGVVAVISPWNYPFAIPCGEVALALVAGNAVLLKPSEITPLTGLKVGELFERAGLPEGLLQVLTGDGATGAALVSQPVDKIAFTGSVATGLRIAGEAARRLIPVVLELGGKDPALVFADAPVERTARGVVWGAFVNCGQTCASVERCYVEASISARFTDRAVEEVRRLRLGPGPDDIDVGPLASERQLETVAAHVEDAVARGARVLTGGRRRDDLGGYFYEPTVLTGVDHTMRIMREETFGPVLPIMAFGDEDEAVRLANDSPYGLLASVWTADRRRAERVAARLEAGTVVINDALYTHGAAETPWFGVKQSGMGVVHSEHGLREFTRLRHVNWDRAPAIVPPWWFPYTPAWTARIRAFVRVVYGRGLRRFIP
jgi:succinate-semialdehyde dehydrogenase/glutarate-semialdehyde dehydrogenase